MNYSRIYQLMPSGSEGELAFNSAISGSNDDDVHHILFDSLRAVFHTHPRRQFGLFDPELTGAALAAGISGYHSQNLNAENLGLNLARHMQQTMGEKQAEPPWYLWFIVEQSGEDQCIYLFLLKHDEGYRISARQAVTAGGTILPGHLQYAVKLNLDEWRGAQSKTYLSYLTPKNQHPLTLAWRELIGFTEGANRAEQTEGFLTALERYVEELPPEKEREYRARVIDYCLDQERAGDPVEIKALSRHVDEEAPDALLNFFTEHIAETTPAQSPDRLYPDRKHLKRYTRFYGRDNDLSIGFSTLMLGRNIIYDENTETLTIRAIPKSLKSQLARHVKKAE